MQRENPKLVDDWQTISYLTKNYRNIILPPFRTKEMRGPLGSLTNRNIDNYRHYCFKTRMITKCRERGNSLHIRGEEYTSKTCGNCGQIKYSLGSSKRFDCGKCGWSFDRDANGARNTMIKNMEKKSSIVLRFFTAWVPWRSRFP